MTGTTAEVHHDFTLDDSDLEVAEIDGTLHMEMLQDAEYSNTEHTEGDRLGFVIRSLEAEIGPPSAMVDGCDNIELLHNYCEDCEDCSMDDILSDLDSHNCSGSSTHIAVEDPFDWVEMEMEVGSNSAGDDMRGWYIDEQAVEVYGDLRDYSTYGYGDQSSTEQVYSPLWE